MEGRVKDRHKRSPKLKAEQGLADENAEPFDPRVRLRQNPPAQENQVSDLFPARGTAPSHSLNVSPQSFAAEAGYTLLHGHGDPIRLEADRHLIFLQVRRQRLSTSHHKALIIVVNVLLVKLRDPRRCVLRHRAILAQLQPLGPARPQGSRQLCHAAQQELANTNCTQPSHGDNPEA